MSTRRSQLYEFGPYRLDIAERRLERDGAPVPLTPKAFETLVALVERSGHLVEKNELMKAVWADTFVEESNLTNNIYELRKILGHAEDGRSYIETVPKRGYRFVGPVVAPSTEALIVEKRTLTRIVTEQREEEPPGRLAITRAIRQPRSLLLASALVVVGAIALYGGYRLIARQDGAEKATSRVPFEAMDISRVTTTGNITHSAISADGKYVATVVKDASGNSVWLKHLDAPSNVRIAGPAVTEYISVAFAPSTDSISYVYYIALDHDKGVSTLFRVPVMGGNADTVASDIYPIGFSPNGERIAFIRPNDDSSTLVVANADGSNQRVVAARRKPDFFLLEWNAPAWSPDGKTIVCPVSLTDQRGRYETLVGVDPTDGSQVPLTGQRWSSAGQAAWLPNGGGLLATAREHSDSPKQVWHVRAHDGRASQVTHDLNNYEDLSLTAAGDRLVAVQVQAVSTISVAPTTGAASATREQKSLTRARSEAGVLDAVAWTRDGRIVFASNAGNSGSDIWIMNADGSNAKQLTVGARVAQGLTTTTDGRYIVFSSGVTGGFHLWRVDTDGGNLRQLTNGGGEFYPHATPDGRWVVYQTDLRNDPRVWKVPIDGGQPQQLTTTRAAKPAVSPDGRMIAYTYLDSDLRPSRWGIGIVPSAGGGRVKRFDFPQTVIHRYIRWSPDGRSIAFVNDAGGYSDIWLQPLDGSGAKPLTDFRAEQIVAFDWSSDGRALAFVRTVETSDVVRIQSR